MLILQYHSAVANFQSEIEYKRFFMILQGLICFELEEDVV